MAAGDRVSAAQASTEKWQNTQIGQHKYHHKGDMMTIMRSLRSAIPGVEWPITLIIAQRTTRDLGTCSCRASCTSCQQHQESKDGTEQSGIMPYSHEHSMPHAKLQIGHIHFKVPEKLLWA